MRVSGLNLATRVCDNAPFYLFIDVDNLQSTNIEFKKFVSDELAIARTIWKRGPLHSLSEKQQLRIERIRQGLQAGSKAENEALPTTDYQVESLEVTRKCIRNIVSEQIDCES